MQVDKAAAHAKASPPPVKSEGWSRRRPNAGGRWLWREDRNREEVELTLTADGRAVAESEDAKEGTPQFYWDSTATTQQMMPGQWKRVAGVKARPS